MSVLVVTGTDAAVGKTMVTAAVAALALGRGSSVAVVKPAQTGLRTVIISGPNLLPYTPLLPTSIAPFRVRFQLP